MHPEVEQDRPGDCPKCGMTLEPKTVTAGTEEVETAELSDMTRRFWIGAALGVLYPFFGLLLSPIIAGAAMSLSSVSVIGNALRLRNVRL
jgi:Cu+-exporting ATPase